MGRSWPGVSFKVVRSYWRGHGRLPNLIRPRRFSEKMQWRKLFELDPDFLIFSDKLAVRDWIAERIGPQHLAEHLWSGADPHAIPFDALQAPYFVKDTHGSQHVLYVDSAPGSDRRRGIVAAADAWLARNHGLQTCEPGYVHVPPRILIERPIRNTDGSTPLELKAYVFGGRVRTFLAIETGADPSERRRMNLSRDWTPLAWRFGDDDVMAAPPPRPAGLDEIIRLSETLAAGHGHLRIDIYATDARPYVGEITVYSSSGLSRVVPDEADVTLGDWWPLDASPMRALRAVARGRWEIPQARRPARTPLVEPRGVEPLTSSLRTRRSTN